LVTALAVVAGIIAAFVVAGIVSAVVRSAGRRSPVAADLARRCRRPLRAVLLVVAAWVALLLTTDTGDAWFPAVQHGLRVALIAATAWLVGMLAFVVEDAAVARFRVDVPDNRHARRVRTQVQVLRRVTVAVLVVGAVAAVLLTFQGARTFGAGLLASAGLISIVAGLAAQSSLANLFAGVQLAFTDAIRVDDVVVVDDEWGRIEEITLTYIVVHVWDDRRLILPSTYFTTTPFENWTRRAADLLGTVELDLDWAVPVEDMRGELARLLEATELWDRRVGILQVTEAVGGYVRVRALASAIDAPTLFDLRCYVREGLVAWLQESAPHGVPRTRLENVDAARLAATGKVARRTRTATTPERPSPGDTQWLQQTDSRLFTGSIDALERSRAFAGPGSDVIAERESAAEGGDPRADRAALPVRVVGPPLPAAAPEPEPYRAAAPAQPEPARTERAYAEQAPAEPTYAAPTSASPVYTERPERATAERALRSYVDPSAPAYAEPVARPYAAPERTSTAGDVQSTTVMRPTPAEPTRAPSRSSVLPAEPDASAWRATWDLPGSEQLTALPASGAPRPSVAPERTSAYPHDTAQPWGEPAPQPTSPPLGTRRQRQAQPDATAVYSQEELDGYAETRHRSEAWDAETDGPPTSRYDWRGGE
jgi:small-conductance mechanosensitive channel